LPQPRLDFIPGDAWLNLGRLKSPIDLFNLGRGQRDVFGVEAIPKVSDQLQLLGRGKFVDDDGSRGVRLGRD